MSENGEIYTADKNFKLPPAVTALTNSTSVFIPPSCMANDELCTGLSERNSSPIYFRLMMIIVRQGGRSCAKPRRAFTEKFGLGQKN